MDGNESKIEARRKLVLDELNYTATRITELARIVGFGLAGLIFFFSTSSAEFARAAMRHYGDQILYLSIWGGLVILLEYFQFLFARIALYEAGPRVDDPSRELFIKTNASRLASWAFGLKQLVSIVGVAWFAVILYLLTSLPPDDQNRSGAALKTSSQALAPVTLPASSTPSAAQPSEPNKR